MPTVSKKAFNDKVKALFDEQFSQFDAADVPTIDDKRLTHGATGLEGEFAFLYVDLRGSSDLGNSHRRQTIAKIYKAFHFCMVEIIKEKGGRIRSFDGDRVMGVFGGTHPVNDAVDAAMMMIGAKHDVLAPKISSYYKNDSFDLGVGIATGKALCVKAGVGYDKNNRDLVWIGTPPNLGAKLSDEASHPHNIVVCATTFDRLANRNRWTKDQFGNQVDMWSYQYITFAGTSTKVFACKYYRSL